MRNFLLEIGTEEMPPFEIEEITNQFSEKLLKLLKDEGFEFENYKLFSTPRRFAIIIYHLSEKGQDKFVERIGPPYDLAFKEGKPTSSLIGFAKSINVSVDELYKVEKNGKFYIAGKQLVKGKTLKELISEKFEDIIRSINVKKSMFWLEGANFKFIRPIRWILCIYGNEVIEFNFLNIKSSNWTYGHRILSNKRIEINNVDEYESVLEKHFVIADAQKRFNKIIEEIKKINYSPYFDENLYKEINGLVEYPFIALCEFDESYLKLPDKIIITAMKSHQRYIALFEDGKITNKFIAIVNNFVNDEMKKNLSKVLKARLEDAKFYFENDLKKPLISYLEDLKEIQFLEGLGSIYEKIQRVLKLSDYFISKMKLNESKLKRAIMLYKNDLATSILREGKEFVELEGYISSIYAKLSGEDQEVVQIIYDSTLLESPKTKEGIILSIIDRIDTIASILSTGYKIKGNYDPLGLKKTTYELFEIILNFQIDFDFIEAFEILLNELKFNLQDIKDFIYSRLENYFIEKLNYDYDVVLSVISTKPTNIYEIFKRIEFLKHYKEKRPKELSEIVTAYKRLYNIIKDKKLLIDIKTELFESEYETKLYRILKESDFIENSLKNRNYEEIFEFFLKAKIHIDNFFDNVFVMVDNEEIRNNRLALISSIKNLFDYFADFSKIV
ncbi:MAG: glycine--tRNA ligase subunit beta [Candidatus Hydrothermia bacterium]|nr:glycine--tRNA ligase subunit beta [Candidatus Hydrothermia bacterium]